MADGLEWRSQLRGNHWVYAHGGMTVAVVVLGAMDSQWNISLKKGGTSRTLFGEHQTHSEPTLEAAKRWVEVAVIEMELDRG